MTSNFWNLERSNLNPEPYFKCHYIVNFLKEGDFEKIKDWVNRNIWKIKKCKCLQPAWLNTSTVTVQVETLRDRTGRSYQMMPGWAQAFPLSTLGVQAVMMISSSPFHTIISWFYLIIKVATLAQTYSQIFSVKYRIKLINNLKYARIK